jgi:hypothetical protein
MERKRPHGNFLGKLIQYYPRSFANSAFHLKIYFQDKIS